MCTDYATCAKLIKSGTEINYEGAGGSDDFNVHHNVFSGFSIIGFNGAPTGKQVANVAAAAISKLIG